jgi:hypothetical protein
MIKGKLVNLWVLSSISRNFRWEQRLRAETQIAVSALQVELCPEMPKTNRCFKSIASNVLCAGHM